MTLQDQLRIERLKRGHFWPSLPAASDLGVTIGGVAPSGYPVIVSLDGVETIAAIHSVDGNEFYLMRLDSISGDWRVVREASPEDAAMIGRAMRNEQSARGNNGTIFESV